MALAQPVQIKSQRCSSVSLGGIAEARPVEARLTGLGRQLAWRDARAESPIACQLAALRVT